MSAGESSLVNLKNIQILKFDIHFSSNVCGWVCHICLPVSNNCNKTDCFFFVVVVELLYLIIIANAASKQGMWRVTKNTNN